MFKRWGKAEGFPHDGTTWAESRNGGGTLGKPGRLDPLAPPLMSSVASGSSRVLILSPAIPAPLGNQLLTHHQTG